MLPAENHLPTEKNLMGGIKLILVQLSSETDWSTAYLVKTSDLESLSTQSEKQVKENILCEQEFRYKSIQEQPPRACSTIRQGYKEIWFIL